MNTSILESSGEWEKLDGGSSNNNRNLCKKKQTNPSGFQSELLLFNN